MVFNEQEEEYLLHWVLQKNPPDFERKSEDRGVELKIRVLEENGGDILRIWEPIVRIVFVYIKRQRPFQFIIKKKKRDNVTRTTSLSHRPSKELCRTHVIQI